MSYQTLGTIIARPFDPIDLAANHACALLAMIAALAIPVVLIGLFVRGLRIVPYRIVHLVAHSPGMPMCARKLLLALGLKLIPSERPANYLGEACRANDLPLVKYLCSHQQYGITSNTLRSHKNSILRDACCFGSVELVQYLCETKRFGIVAYDICDERCRAIIDACKSGNAAVLRYLYENPQFGFAASDASRKHLSDTIKGRKVLDVVCERGHIDVLRYLCETASLRIVPDVINARNNAALVRACLAGQLAIVQYLCEDARIAKCFSTGSARTNITADDIRANDFAILRAACKPLCDLRVAHYLCDSPRFGINREYVRADDYRMLYVVCDEGNAEFFRSLCEDPRFNISASDIHWPGLPILCKAVDNFEIFCYLCDEPRFAITRVDICAHDHYIMAHAYVAGNVDIIQYLRDNETMRLTEADADAYKISALRLARTDNNAEAIRRMCENPFYGITAEHVRANNDELLSEAHANNLTEIVQYLLNNPRFGIVNADFERVMNLTADETDTAALDAYYGDILREAVPKAKPEPTPEPMRADHEEDQPTEVGLCRPRV